MNKVHLRCQKDSCAKFYYTSKRMFFEVKLIKVILYILAVIPVILTFTPQVTPTQVFICSIISFSLTLMNEIISSFVSNHREHAILEHQLYESEITGSTFSKIEYDREATNEMNELAIRKGLPIMKKVDEYPIVEVPDEIGDDYSYIYLCRKNSATTRYLLSRIFYVYFFILMCIIALFVGATLIENTTTAYLSLLIGFYPLVYPIIKDCLGCKKCMRQCAKICADIDNFFADGDASVERLARFYYYVQNIEFEMMMNRPAIFNIFPFLFRKKIEILQEGITSRFIEAINELLNRSILLKGTKVQPHGKALITKSEVQLGLKEKEKLKAKKATTSKTPVPQEKKDVKKKETTTPVKKTATKKK